MPDHICYEGTLMYACPVTPEISIEAAQKLTKGNHVTIRGRIVEVKLLELIFQLFYSVKFYLKPFSHNYEFHYFISMEK